MGLPLAEVSKENKIFATAFGAKVARKCLNKMQAGLPLLFSTLMEALRLHSSTSVVLSMPSGTDVLTYCYETTELF